MTDTVTLGDPISGHVTALTALHRHDRNCLGGRAVTLRARNYAARSRR